MISEIQGLQNVDQAGMAARLRSLLPRRWFPFNDPISTALLLGFGALWAQVISLLQYVTLQMRIKTATEGNLDLISKDYLGYTCLRTSGETDAHFRARILAAILAPRNTYQAVQLALETLTGHQPAILRPRYAPDTGGLGTQGSTTWTGLAYDVAGAWGCTQYTQGFEFFVTAYRPTQTPPGNVPGYDCTQGGLDCSQSAMYSYADMGLMPDSEILACVAQTITCGAVAWVNIESLVKSPVLVYDVGDDYDAGYIYDGQEA